MNEFFNTGLGKTLLIIGIVFLAILTLGQLEGLRYIGAGITAANTISVSGHGESLAVPDIATFSFSVVSDQPTVAAAQADATTEINAVTAYLTGAGVDKNDIQTSDYSVEPQYNYVQGTCSAGVYCPSNQVLKGYEVSQTTTVKVRDTSKAGDLLAGVGTKGATQVSGLSFTFDNPTAVQNDARTKAIADARAKADTLAQELGVTLVRVVSFSENTNGNPGPVPVYAMAAGSSADKAVSAPAISVGQNTVTDDVTVTYEIK
jgi:uncharacterized protein